MIPWEELDTAAIPDGGGQLRLMRRGAEFSIMAGSTELMNSRVRGSEEALATLSLERLRDRSNPNILIGGLGMGFTIRAALAARTDVTVTVAELVPAVVAWARGALAPVFIGSLDDPRVEVVVGDVGTLIRPVRNAYDAILLDVDNGPGGLSRAANDGLYSVKGLAAARLALRPRGILAVWSSHPDSGFTRRLQQSGFAVEELPVRANGRRGARHLIWMATRDR